MRLAAATLVLVLLACSATGESKKASPEHRNDQVDTKAGAQPARPTGAEEAKPELGLWDGFRGVRWGTQLSSLSGFKTANQTTAQAGNYTRDSEKLMLGGARLKDVVWRFYRGRLYHVLVEAQPNTFDALKSVTIERFGKSYKNTSTEYLESYTWSGSNSKGESVTFEVKRDKQTGRVSGFFTYAPLEQAESNDATQTERTKRERRKLTESEQAKSGARSDF